MYYQHVRWDEARPTLAATPGVTRTLNRVLLTWLYDANAMVGKLEVRSGQLDFWHMTGHAFVPGYFAGLRTRFSAAVAPQAFLIVIERLAA